MSSCKKIIVLIFLGLVLLGCQPNNNTQNENTNIIKFKEVKTKYYYLEDYYIMYAIELENNNFFSGARDIYIKLFELTNNYEYFEKYITLSAQLNQHQFVKEQIEKYDIKDIKQEETLQRLYIYSLLQLKENEKANEKAINLAKKFNSQINYSLLATTYLVLDDYANGLKNLNEALKLEYSPKIVLKIANIEYYKLNKQEEAVGQLKKHIISSNYDFDLCFQLLSFYKNLDQENNFLRQLKLMFIKYKKNDDEESLNKTKILFYNYINKKISIEFWENQKEYDDFLLTYYMDTQEFKKALNLANILYDETQNIDYLGKQAIIEFEMAEDKTSVLNEIIKKFSLVLDFSNDHVYQNYLAYLLIDYDIDIKKGLKLVKKALQQDPKNLSYLDTLAWGEYKAKNCKEAYSLMKKIVDEVGTSNIEIKEHWEKIQECKSDFR